ncbi:MAG: hypothetical protein QOI64_2142, partial [Solirubrobacteraceae bacterium]|nr:hypothetical protein [Solirubrobacteraceae bacterium]
MRRLLATILLPLSLIPVALAVPYVAGQHEAFRARYIEREALAAPVVGRLASASVPVYRDKVPVLVYHGLNEDGGRWTIDRAGFARQMAALDAAG